MFKKILQWITGTSKTVLDFISPILEKTVSDILAAILPIALDIVRSLATDTSKSGADKRNEAFNRIKDVAVKKGIDAGNQTINLAIELALAKLNSK